ncbi:MAG: cyanophycinase [Bdellovibrionales bacterium]|nr:cyanophycinase [Bdellovibrionales bacterium]
MVRRGLFSNVLVFGLLCLTSLIALPSLAASHLILIGGGTRPKGALEVIARATDTVHPLVILPWGTAEPDDVIKTMTQEFQALGAPSVVGIRRQDYSSSALQVIRSAGAIYFPGGDQNKIIDNVLSAGIAQQLRGLCESGVLIGGTSAGTAIASNPMLTGDSAYTAMGLGFLPGVLVDQHFWVRKREPRMLKALDKLVQQNPHIIGYGIDEGMAAEFIDGRMAHVWGATRISKYTRGQNGQWVRKDFTTSQNTVERI